MYDTIIIGIGPAAIQASIYLSRYGLKTLLIGKDYGALAKAKTIDNYFGFDNINGLELLLKGMSQAQNLGALINKDEVLTIEGNFEEGFKVIAKKGTYEAKTIIIATGLFRNTLNIKGFKDLDGKGISYCAICDGFFYRKKKLAILGNSDYLSEELNVLKDLTTDITIFTNGRELEVDNYGFKVITDEILSFNGENKLESITTNKTTITFDGCFVALGSASGYEFSRHLGIICDDKKHIVVDDKFETNVSGIYAIGDCIGGLLQIVKACSDGANAALHIKNKIHKKTN